MSQALCIKRSDLPEMVANIDSEGVAPGNQDWRVFDLKAELIDRSICEIDPDYLQIIPYISLYIIPESGSSKFFVYQRGSGSEEGRLEGMHSIGLGGHIETAPLEGQTVIDIITAEAVRELQEEVGFKDVVRLERTIRTLLEQNCYLYIYTGTDDVGKVHLGIAMSIKVLESDLGDMELNTIINGEWVSPQELLKEDTTYAFERWSELFLYYLTA